MSEELDYEKDLSIDPEALDVEWLDQAMRFMRYSKLLAEAERTAKRAHEKVKITRSELIFEGKSKGEVKIDGEMVKLTNTDLLEAYYRTSPKHKEVKTKLIEVEYEVDQLRTAVFAFNQRKSTLENLVKLHGQNYFAGPTEPRNIGEESSVLKKDSGRKGMKRST